MCEFPWAKVVIVFVLALALTMVLLCRGGVVEKAVRQLASEQASKSAQSIDQLETN